MQLRLSFIVVGIWLSLTVILYNFSLSSVQSNKSSQDFTKRIPVRNYDLDYANNTTNINDTNFTTNYTNEINDTNETKNQSTTATGITTVPPISFYFISSLFDGKVLEVRKPNSFGAGIHLGESKRHNSTAASQLWIFTQDDYIENVAGGFVMGYSYGWVTMDRWRLERMPHLRWTWNSSRQTFSSKADSNMVLTSLNNTLVVRAFKEGNTTQKWNLLPYNGTGVERWSSTYLTPEELAHYPPPVDAEVPKIVHYTWLNSDVVQLPVFVFVSIMATVKVVQPEIIYFHAYICPNGSWWDIVKPYLTIIYIKELPSEIFGNKVQVLEHVADIIRLEVLLKYGGIFFDTDIIPLKPLDSYLRYDMTMGEQNPYCICPAVVITKRDSPFLKRWYQSYRTFKDYDWDSHSVQRPVILTRRFPNEINVLSTNKIYYPSHHSTSDLFVNTVNISNNVAIHLWNSISKGEGYNRSVEYIISHNSTVNLIARPYIIPFLNNDTIKL